MSDTTESNDERPCLHCLIGDVIDDFYDDYGSLSGEKDTIDVDEIVTALAKTVLVMPIGSRSPALAADRIFSVRERVVREELGFQAGVGLHDTRIDRKAFALD